MKILITGANGFIGSYLAHYFLKKNHEVIAYSRQFHPSTRKLLNNATLVEADILNKQQLEQLPAIADSIIHGATANDIVSKNTLKGIELSAIGTKNVMDFAISNNIPEVMVFSTLQVYGTELTGPIDESTSLHYQNDYGLNHLIAEMYAELYSRQGKLKTVAVRPSNVYGRIITDAFNRWTLVPGCFCKEVMESGTITIRSSGKQMRNFVNLENLSRAVECILADFPPNYECYNLASSQGLTMKEMAEKVKNVFETNYQKPVQINITGTEPASINHFTISLERLKSIGFTEDEDFTPETEIAEIFKYLQTKQNT
jgi:UDP-glucose 4-epimerase